MSPLRKRTPLCDIDLVAIGKRIRMARQVLKITTKALEQKYGFTSAMVSYTERGITGPSYRILFVLQQYYNVSPKWILSGEGEMLNSEYDLRKEPMGTVPIISAAGCGPGRTLELSEDTLQLPQLYLSRLVNPIVCRAAGRSMVPYIMPGDYAVVDRAEEKRLHIDRLKTYLVNDPDTEEDVAISLKRVQLVNDCLRLVPINTAEYAETVIPINGTPLLNVVLGTVALIIRDDEQIIQT